MRKIVFFGLFLLCLGIKAQENEYVNAFKNKQALENVMLPGTMSAE